MKLAVYTGNVEFQFLRPAATAARLPPKNTYVRRSLIALSKLIPPIIFKLNADLSRGCDAFANENDVSFMNNLFEELSISKKISRILSNDRDHVI